MAGRARAWLVWHGMAGMAKHGWYGMLRHGMAWYGMAWHGWPGLAWHGMARYDMVWYGMVRHATTGSEVPTALLLVEGPWQPHYLKLHWLGVLPQTHPGRKAWLVWHGMAWPGLASRATAAAFPAQ